MKFAWKIFFISFLLIIISFGTGGFLLVNSVFTGTLDSKIISVTDTNKYVTSSFYAVMENSEIVNSNNTYLKYTANKFADQISKSNSDLHIKIGGISDMHFNDSTGFINDINFNERCYRIVENDGKRYIQVISKILLADTSFYIENLENISGIYESRDNYCRIYQLILIGVALFSSVVLVIFSHFITKPLVKLSSVSKDIAEGDFSKRVEISKATTKTAEIKELSCNFNTMAEYIEDYIEQLKLAAESRDNFVADFTHELKTPLTSVIGYADMLRSYELDAEQRRECADLIYKEGKRLEALSLNLLNLIVLKNNSIELVTIKSDIIIKEIGNAVLFLLKKYGVKLETNFEHTTIIAEASLIKTLLYNLIDNACKASNKGQTVVLKGHKEGEAYKFVISDNGRGIPENEIEKITEPFYMIDKSRARSMGGAGLGLTLCNEIARLHGSELSIKSRLGEGTDVSFTVQCDLEADINEKSD